jgi:GNAT superfamily N-acetyltransferase
MIEVRRGRESDTDMIVGFQMAMARETENLKLDRDTVIRGVQGVFDNPARGTYRVATEADQLLGVMLAIPEWSDWRCGTVLWIHSLYVIPEARGRGVFRMLYENLKDQVEKSDDLAGIRLYVDKRNKSAQEIYEKLGMNKDHYELYEWLKGE